jgi:hypothetical protein
MRKIWFGTVSKIGFCAAANLWARVAHSRAGWLDRPHAPVGLEEHRLPANAGCDSSSDDATTPAAKTPSALGALGTLEEHTAALAVRVRVARGKEMEVAIV